MASRGDFHCHSTASDGVLSPTEVVRLAVRNGVRILALTDHDSTEGIPEAQAEAARHPGFRLIPGIELSTDIPGNEVHVLGYFARIDDPDFQARLARFREGRLGRGRRMVEKLNAMGIDIKWERVLEIAGDASVGRPHVAQALLEAGYVQSIPEAFDKYIGRNGPAYAEREKMTPEEAVSFIVRFHGVAVLAHPRDLEDLDGLLARLKEAGLSGMEVYYQDYDEETIARLKAAADRHGLIPLGGSDYHGLGGDYQREPGMIPLPDGPIQRFLAVCEERWARAEKRAAP